MGTISAFRNPEDPDDRSQSRFYNIKTDCVFVRASVGSIFNASLSVTAGLISTKVGTKVNIDSGFINREN